ncbi:NERD domain-containing protein [Lentibacter algarum]|uniref:nuclease-related domain-containing protein n=1 Tax=Lentibacter algarum TaxID=576131 RepID=UPI001C078B7C|nr:NERD domain-containing protein [Lentibacter algarum]MBU2981269.1 NERD domain-containing protein [Lentibacter algarum]
MLKFLLRSTIWAIENSINTPERKGARGERLVHNALTSVLSEPDYKVLTDLILPIAGGTTQIDHLVLSRFGIFVIETKNMSGWIFGGADQQKWTQVQKRSKRSFQNPLRQNYAHVKAVQKILNVDQSTLHNFVVFTGTAEPKTAMPESVAWGLKDLGKLIALQKMQILTDVQVDTYSKKLRGEALEGTKAMRNEHLKNLEKKVAAKKRTPTKIPAVSSGQIACPRCGAEMIKRTNRRTGDAFWGCSSFPKCKGTRKAT